MDGMVEGYGWSVYARMPLSTRHFFASQSQGCLLVVLASSLDASHSVFSIRMLNNNKMLGTLGSSHGQCQDGNTSSGV